MWNARVVAAVRAAGFHGARALGGGPVNTPSEVFTVRSIVATDDMPVFERLLESRSR